MKYANINYMCPMRMDDEVNRYNIGDWMLMESVFNIYDNAGIPRSDVMVLDYSQLFDYEGEDLILPVTGILAKNYWTDGSVMGISSHIHPIFIGITFDNNKWSDISNRFTYLKQYEPIGCRDDIIYKVLQDNGIKCYLHGCSSIAINRKIPLQNKITYLVDVPGRVWSYIPNELKKPTRF